MYQKIFCQKNTWLWQYVLNSFMYKTKCKKLCELKSKIVTGVIVNWTKHFLYYLVYQTLNMA